MAVERDPAGLLERIPELKQLAERSKGLTRAIERGRPHAVYRELLWMRWLGRAGAQRPLLTTLLGSRRLFVEPMRRTPWLATINGVGATVYGASDEDASDGTYAKTLFLVFVFVPLYPFTSYLVRKPDGGGTGWLFIARLPLSPLLYLWQRGLALALIGVVVFGAAHTYIDSHYQQIHVANGLPVAVDVRIGDQQRTVAAKSVEPLRVRLGKHPLKVLALGKPIELGSVDATRDADVQIWNVLGLGFVYEEQVEYRAKTSDAGSGARPTVHCDERAISLSGIDYVFTTAPSQLKLDSKDATVTRKRVALETEVSCVQYLFAEKHPKRAAEVVARLAEVTGFGEEQSEGAVQLLGRFAGAEPALAFAERALAVHPGSLELHRAYQSVLLYHGRRAEAIERYQKRWQEHHEDADAGYLYARLLPEAEADPIVEQLLAKQPEHAYLLRVQAFREARAGHSERCLAALATLRRVSPKIAAEAFELELSALASSGQIDAARARVLEALKSSQPNQREELAKWGVLLSRFDPPSDSQGILDSLKGNAPETAGAARARVRIEGRLPIEPQEIELLAAGPVRTALSIELLTRTDPAAALRDVASADDAALHNLSPEVWALLLGEAARPGGEERVLEALLQKSMLGVEPARALVKYVREGGECRELEDLQPAASAALRLARTRAATLPSDERRDLLALARREDALHGLVTEALDSWK